MTLSRREEQIAEAEELLGDRLQQVGFAKGMYFGSFANEKLLPYPDLAADQRDDRVGFGTAPLLPGRNRSGGDRSRSDDSPARGRWPRPAWDARRLRAKRIWRPRADANAILPPARSARRTLRQHGTVCERPSFDRPAGDRAVRHAGAETKISAQARQRRMDQRLRPDRA